MSTEVIGVKLNNGQELIARAIRRKVKTEDGRTRQNREYINCVLKDPKDLLREYGLC